MDFITEKSSSITLMETIWKPNHKRTECVIKNKQELDMPDMEEMINKIRCIFNKFTPENFEKLSEEVESYEIVDEDQMKTILNLIFEQIARDEMYSSIYAKVCQVLSHVTIQKNKSDGIEETFTNFQSLLVEKWHQEIKIDNELMELKKTLEKCSINDKVKCKARYEREERNTRKKVVRNMKFFGELVKCNIIPVDYCVYVIGHFYVKMDDHSVECLCKLLTTTGEKLDNLTRYGIIETMGDLTAYFGHMPYKVESEKTSTRSRYMLMDIVELRKNKWVPRQKLEEPKTKAQIHEDIRIEEEIASSPSMTEEDGWIVVTSPISTIHNG